MTTPDPQLAIRHVEARTHGRFVVRVPSGAGPWPLFVGFHGYRENAATHLEALSSIPGIDGWLVVSVQALHPFYTRDQQVVASWMTREDREIAIADNVNYVGRVLDDVRREWPVRRPLVFEGFSQGGAMAYRAAAAYACDAIIVLAADVPPDVAQASTPLPRVLLGRGTTDAWYTAAKCEADLRALSGRARRVEECVFEGGHEWTEPFTAAAGRLLDALELKSPV